MATDTEALTRKDSLYEELFDVERENLELGHAMIDDPYPGFAALRAQAPVFSGDIELELTGHPGQQFGEGRPRFTAMGFDACSKALVDNTTYSSLHYSVPGGVQDVMGKTVLTMVGNEHARYRSAIQPALTRQQAMTWWKDKWIAPIVEVLVEDIAREPTADLVQQLCTRLPMHTVTSAYGLTSDEALTFRDTLLASMSPLATPEQRSANRILVDQTIGNAIAERRRERRDDLISRLIDAPFVDENGEKTFFTDQDIMAFSRLLLLAGGGTTFRQLGITLFALLSNPEQLGQLREDRELMTAAIQEAVRWNCTDPLFHRLTTKDSVLAGTAIPEGAIVSVCLGSANRDPSRWEDPDRYDMHRAEKRHVGFAAGPHTCLGRFVAEAEMNTAINALLDRFPNMRLDDSVSEPAKIIGGLHARGPNHLRVRLD